MKTLEAHEEQELLEAVKQAVDLVEARGLSPTDAVEKIARENDFGPGKIKLVCAAYNTGRQTAQRQANVSILDKLAEFPLADAESVIQNVYHGPTEREKAAAVAVDPAYSQPPHWLDEQRRIKVASATIQLIPATPLVPDPVEQLHKAAGSAQRAKQAAEEASRLHSHATDKLYGYIGQLTTYFRKDASQRLPFSTVEKAASVYFGAKQVAPLMDLVYGRAKLAAFREKRAEDKDAIQSTPLNLRAEPFSIISDCIKAAQEVNATKEAAAKAEANATTVKEAAFRPFLKAGSPVSEKPSIWSEKAAGLFGEPAIGAATGAILSKGIGSPVDSKEDMIQDAWMDLEDPSHQNELRKIKAQAMLTSLMTDPDDPIAGYEPDKVLQAYNEISQMAPRTADQPGALKSLLRRRLAGHTEPFEAKEVTDIEKGLASTKLPTPTTSLLSDAPDKLLG
jgi:hypothetical protein